jgi:hypothetical protein
LWVGYVTKDAIARRKRKTYVERKEYVPRETRSTPFFTVDAMAESDELRLACDLVGDLST